MRVLWDRRQGAFEGLSITIPILQSVGRGEKSVAEAIAALQVRLEDQRRRQTPTSTGYATVYVITIGALKRNENLHLPPDNMPNATPKAEEVMPKEGISRDQARAIVLAHKLEEWKQALDGHLKVGDNNVAN